MCHGLENHITEEDVIRYRLKKLSADERSSVLRRANSDCILCGRIWMKAWGDRAEK